MPVAEGRVPSQGVFQCCVCLAVAPSFQCSGLSSVSGRFLGFWWRESFRVARPSSRSSQRAPSWQPCLNSGRGEIGGELLIGIGWLESRPEFQLVVAALGPREAVVRFASVAAGDVLEAPSSTLPGEMPTPTLFVDVEGRVAIDAGGPLGGTGALLRKCEVDVWEFTPTTFRREVLQSYVRGRPPRLDTSILSGSVKPKARPRMRA